MAAYAALVSLMNDLELIPNHPTHSFSFDKKQIISLSQFVHFLVDFMDNYDSHGCSTEAAQVLESRIASAAHAAHDVIESHIIDQIHAGSTRAGKTRSYFLLDLQRAIDNMEFVKRKATQFQAKSGLKAEQSTYSSSSATTTSSQPMKNNGMVGVEEVVDRLVEIVTGPSNERLVIPIIGMGGLGKTSLAKTVYEHSYLEHHFDIRLWATISQVYSAENILSQLLYPERESTTDSGRSVCELGEELHKKLWCRRYLIVLDDMWSIEAWNGVYRFLPDNGNGSRVVVTTRLSNLAARLSSLPPFEMRFLDEDESWELFCGKTFGEEDCPVELEEIGKKIVKRCKGLPLSIVVIAGHLGKSSRGIEYWEKVAKYMNPISSIGEEEQCLEILSLSYQHLPAYLKPCFLYVGIFKEDEEIDASRLLLYWIGEGFIKPKKESSLEEVGEAYLKDLIDRNLILVDRRSWNGKAECCKVHDIVREMCLKACKKEKFICVVEDTAQVIECTHRRTLIPKGEKLNSNMIAAKQSTPPLRSLVHQGGGNSFLNELLVDCSLLRVLVHDNDIHRETDDTCLAQFQKINLRTIAFDQFGPYFCDSASSLLSSISACWNLQTLYMMGSYQPITLPYEILEMTQLRHLQVHAVSLPDFAPDGGSKQEACIILQNLYTLEGVADLRLTEEVFRRMPNLEKLILWYKHVSDDYCLHNLSRFDKLKRLLIKFDDDSRWCDDVLSLTFPTSLEELHFINCHLQWKDLTAKISSLPRLGSLEIIKSVRGAEWNFEEEEFCCLKSLLIHSCPDLIYWNANSSHFPVLESLVLHKIPNLNEIPLDIGEITTLRLIWLRGCGVSVAVSGVRIVMEQETCGNYDLQLRIEYWENFREEFEGFQEMMQQECLATNSLHLYYDGKKIKNTL